MFAPLIGSQRLPLAACAWLVQCPELLDVIILDKSPYGVPSWVPRHRSVTSSLECLSILLRYSLCFVGDIFRRGMASVKGFMRKHGADNISPSSLPSAANFAFDLAPHSQHIGTDASYLPFRPFSSAISIERPMKIEIIFDPTRAGPTPSLSQRVAPAPAALVPNGRSNGGKPAQRSVIALPGQAQVVPSVRLWISTHTRFPILSTFPVPIVRSLAS